MIRICRFDSVRDLQETVPNLSICLKDAIASGTVKDIGVASEPNGIDDVENVGGIVDNAFDAFEHLHNVQSDVSGVYKNNGGQPDKAGAE